MNLTHAFAPITKTEKADDGTLLVYGKMTGPDLDLDGQICDPTWLKTAVPQWFDSGANIRLMHQAHAAGVGVELEATGDDYWLTAKIVDPHSVKLVEEGVLQGFSIGIKSPRLVKDAGAPNGRIVGGKIIENSLVDRPCNETAKLVLAKMAGDDLVEVEEIADVTKAEDMADETAEQDYLLVARTALSAWLAAEAQEVAAGTGGTGVVRIICDLLCDLAWAEEVDCWDDQAAALAAVKTALTTPHREDTVNLTTVAELCKAATAADAPDTVKADLADLRKALGIDDVAEQLATITTEAKTAAAQELEKLAARLAKVEDTVVSVGPARTRTSVDAAKAAEVDTALARAAHYEQLAKAVTDHTLADGYRALAEAERLKVA